MSRTTRECKLAARSLFAIVFLAGSLPFAAAPPQAKPEQDKVLRQRVEELYGLMQNRRWSEAETYFTNDSVEAFREEKRGPLLGFRVGSIKVEPDGQNATVEVQAQTMSPLAPAPITIPLTTHWRLVDGVWRVQLPKPTTSIASATESSEKAPPPREELKFKGHRYMLGTLEQGQVKTARFPFTNVTDHVVRLTDVVTACDCLRVKLEKKEYKPGESGELAVDFNSAEYVEWYEQTILVKTDPGDLTTRLTVRAYVNPAPPSQGSAPEKPPSSAPQPDSHKPGGH